MSIIDLIARNLPRRKPQFWENLTRSVARRLAFESFRRLSTQWIDDAHVVRLTDGARLAVVPRDGIGRAIYLYGMYEAATTKFVSAILRPGDCFIDVGANSGYYSVIAGRRVGATGVVHAFEPVPRLRALMARNLELNKLSNVVVHDTALWRIGGELAFYETSSKDNSGTSSALPGPGRAAVPRTVRAVTLDEVACSVGRRIDLVKIDVEGGEMAVLEGGRELLSSSEAPALVIETRSIDGVAELLQRSGYELRSLGYSRLDGAVLCGIGSDQAGVFSTYEAPNFLAATACWCQARSVDLHSGPAASR